MCPITIGTLALKQCILFCCTQILNAPSIVMWLLASFTVNTLLISAVLVLCLYIYLTRHFNYWKKRGIPYIEPLPLFGNLKEVFLQKRNFGDHFRVLYNEYKHLPYLGIYAIDRPALMVNDLDLIKNILVKDAQFFQDRIITGDAKADPIFVQNLFTLKGETWRYLRHKMSPTFTSGKMKLMFHLVNACAKNLNRAIEASLVQGKLNMM